jgi:hypothetical protein
MSSTVHSSQDVCISGLKNKAVGNLKIVMEMLESCTDAATIEAVSGHISSAISVMKAHTNYPSCTSLLISQKPGPNSNNRIQHRFKSTKKKPSRSVHTLSKPNETEKSNAEKTLLSVDIRVCGICFKEEDGSIEDMVRWMQCGECSLWFHITCLGVHVSSEAIDKINCALHVRFHDNPGKTSGAIGKLDACMAA